MEGRADASVVYQPRSGFKLSAVPLRTPVKFSGSVDETDGEYTVTELQVSDLDDEPVKFIASTPSEEDVDGAERKVSTAARTLLTYDGDDAEYANRQEDFYLTTPRAPVPPPGLRDKSNPYFPDAPQPGQSPRDRLLLAKILYGPNVDLCTDERAFRSIRPAGAFYSEDISDYSAPGALWMDRCRASR